jgi:hypothetical protein
MKIEKTKLSEELEDLMEEDLITFLTFMNAISFAKFNVTVICTILIEGLHAS